MILHELFREVSRFPRYSSCYIVESRFPLGQCSIHIADIVASYLHNTVKSSYFANTFAKINLFAKPLILVNQGPRWVEIQKG